jgi:hypothetical protein
MRISRLALPLVVLLSLPLLSPVWARADGKDDKRVRISEYAEGNAYCPRRPMGIGTVIVPAGRCYTLAVFRNERGAYLAFLDPTVRLHRHEAEHLTGWEGRRAWNQILFLVPIPSGARIALIPMNTIQLIRLREEDADDDEDQPRARRSALVVVVPASTMPNVSVTFVITF